jgi:hypothetical protein
MPIDRRRMQMKRICNHSGSCAMIGVLGAVAVPHRIIRLTAAKQLECFQSRQPGSSSPEYAAIRQRQGHAVGSQSLGIEHWECDITDVCTDI